MELDTDSADEVRVKLEPVRQRRSTPKRKKRDDDDVDIKLL